MWDREEYTPFYPLFSRRVCFATMPSGTREDVMAVTRGFGSAEQEAQHEAQQSAQRAERQAAEIEAKKRVIPQAPNRDVTFAGIQRREISGGVITGDESGLSSSSYRSGAGVGGEDIWSMKQKLTPEESVLQIQTLENLPHTWEEMVARDPYVLFRADAEERLKALPESERPQIIPNLTEEEIQQKVYKAMDPDLSGLGSIYGGAAQLWYDMLTIKPTTEQGWYAYFKGMIDNNPNISWSVPHVGTVTVPKPEFVNQDVLNDAYYSYRNVVGNEISSIVGRSDFSEHLAPLPLYDYAQPDSDIFRPVSEEIKRDSRIVDALNKSAYNQKIKDFEVFQRQFYFNPGMYQVDGGGAPGGGADPNVQAILAAGDWGRGKGKGPPPGIIASAMKAAATGAVDISYLGPEGSLKFEAAKASGYKGLSGDQLVAQARLQADNAQIAQTGIALDSVTKLTPSQATQRIAANDAAILSIARASTPLTPAHLANAIAEARRVGSNPADVLASWGFTQAAQRAGGILSGKTQEIDIDTGKAKVNPYTGEPVIRDTYKMMTAAEKATITMYMLNKGVAQQYLDDETNIEMHEQQATDNKALNAKDNGNRPETARAVMIAEGYTFNKTTNLPNEKVPLTISWVERDGKFQIVPNIEKIDGKWKENTYLTATGQPKAWIRMQFGGANDRNILIIDPKAYAEGKFPENHNWLTFAEFSDLVVSGRVGLPLTDAQKLEKADKAATAVREYNTKKDAWDKAKQEQGIAQSNLSLADMAAGVVTDIGAEPVLDWSAFSGMGQDTAYAIQVLAPNFKAGDPELLKAIDRYAEQTQTPAYQAWYLSDRKAPNPMDVDYIIRGTQPATTDGQIQRTANLPFQQYTTSEIYTADKETYSIEGGSGGLKTVFQVDVPDGNTQTAITIQWVRDGKVVDERTYSLSSQKGQEALTYVVRGSSGKSPTVEKAPTLLINQAAQPSTPAAGVPPVTPPVKAPDGGVVSDNATAPLVLEGQFYLSDNISGKGGGLYYKWNGNEFALLRNTDNKDDKTPVSLLVRKPGGDWESKSADQLKSMTADKYQSDVMGLDFGLKFLDRSGWGKETGLQVIGYDPEGNEVTQIDTGLGVTLLSESKLPNQQRRLSLDKVIKQDKVTGEISLADGVKKDGATIFLLGYDGCQYCGREREDINKVLAEFGYGGDVAVYYLDVENVLDRGPANLLETGRIDGNKLMAGDSAFKVTGRVIAVPWNVIFINGVKVSNKGFPQMNDSEIKFYLDQGNVSKYSSKGSDGNVVVYPELSMVANNLPSGLFPTPPAGTGTYAYGTNELGKPLLPRPQATYIVEDTSSALPGQKRFVALPNIIEATKIGDKKFDFRLTGEAKDKRGLVVFEFSQPRANCEWCGKQDDYVKGLMGDKVGWGNDKFTLYKANTQDTTGVIGGIVPGTGPENKQGTPTNVVFYIDDNGVQTYVGTYNAFTASDGILSNLVSKYGITKREGVGSDGKITIYGKPTFVPSPGMPTPPPETAEVITQLKSIWVSPKEGGQVPAKDSWFGLMVSSANPIADGLLVTKDTKPFTTALAEVTAKEKQTKGGEAVYPVWFDPTTESIKVDALPEGLKHIGNAVNYANSITYGGDNLAVGRAPIGWISAFESGLKEQDLVELEQSLRKTMGTPKLDTDVVVASTVINDAVKSQLYDTVISPDTGAVMRVKKTEPQMISILKANNIDADVYMKPESKLFTEWLDKNVKPEKWGLFTQYAEPNSAYPGGAYWKAGLTLIDLAEIAFIPSVLSSAFAKSGLVGGAGVGLGKTALIVGCPNGVCALPVAQASVPWLIQMFPALAGTTASSIATNLASDAAITNIELPKGGALPVFGLVTDNQSASQSPKMPLLVSVVSFGPTSQNNMTGLQYTYNGKDYFLEKPSDLTKSTKPVSMWIKDNGQWKPADINDVGIQVGLNQVANTWDARYDVRIGEGATFAEQPEIASTPPVAAQEPPVKAFSAGSVPSNLLPKNLPPEVGGVAWIKWDENGVITAENILHTSIFTIRPEDDFNKDWGTHNVGSSSKTYAQCGQGKCVDDRFTMKVAIVNAVKAAGGDINAYRSTVKYVPPTPSPAPFSTGETTPPTTPITPTPIGIPVSKPTGMTDTEYVGYMERLAKSTKEIKGDVVWAEGVLAVIKNNPNVVEAATLIAKIPRPVYTYKAPEPVVQKAPEYMPEIPYTPQSAEYEFNQRMRVIQSKIDNKEALVESEKKFQELAKFYVGTQKKQPNYLSIMDAYSKWEKGTVQPIPTSLPPMEKFFGFNWGVSGRPSMRVDQKIADGEKARNFYESAKLKLGLTDPDKYASLRLLNEIGDMKPVGVGIDLSADEIQILTVAPGFKDSTTKKIDYTSLANRLGIMKAQAVYQQAGRDYAIAHAADINPPMPTPPRYATQSEIIAQRTVFITPAMTAYNKVLSNPEDVTITPQERFYFNTIKDAYKTTDGKLNVNKAYELIQSSPYPIEVKVEGERGGGKEFVVRQTDDTSGYPRIAPTTDTAPPPLMSYTQWLMSPNPTASPQPTIDQLIGKTTMSPAEVPIIKVEPKLWYEGGTAQGPIPPVGMWYEGGLAQGPVPPPLALSGLSVYSSPQSSVDAFNRQKDYYNTQVSSGKLPVQVGFIFIGYDENGQPRVISKDKLSTYSEEDQRILTTEGIVAWGDKLKVDRANAPIVGSNILALYNRDGRAFAYDLIEKGYLPSTVRSWLGTVYDQESVNSIMKSLPKDGELPDSQYFEKVFLPLIKGFVLLNSFYPRTKVSEIDTTKQYYFEKTGIDWVDSIIGLANKARADKYAEITTGEIFQAVDYIKTHPDDPRPKYQFLTYLAASEIDPNAPETEQAMQKSLAWSTELAYFAGKLHEVVEPANVVVQSVLASLGNAGTITPFGKVSLEGTDNRLISPITLYKDPATGEMKADWIMKDKTVDADTKWADVAIQWISERFPKKEAEQWANALEEARVKDDVGRLISVGLGYDYAISSAQATIWAGYAFFEMFKAMGGIIPITILKIGQEVAVGDVSKAAEDIALNGGGMVLFPGQWVGEKISDIGRGNWPKVVGESIGGGISMVITPHALLKLGWRAGTLATLRARGLTIADVLDPRYFSKETGVPMARVPNIMQGLVGVLTEAKLSAVYRGRGKEAQRAWIMPKLTIEAQRYFKAANRIIDNASKAKTNLAHVAPNGTVKFDEMSNRITKEQAGRNVLKLMREWKDKVALGGSLSDFLQMVGIDGQYKGNDIDLYILKDKNGKAYFEKQYVMDRLFKALKDGGENVSQDARGKIVSGKEKIAEVHIYGEIPLHEFGFGKELSNAFLTVDGFTVTPIQDQIFRRGKEAIRPGVGEEFAGFVGHPYSGAEYLRRSKDVGRFILISKMLIDDLRIEGKGELADKLQGDLNVLVKGEMGKPLDVAIGRGAVTIEDFIKLVGDVQDLALRVGGLEEGGKLTPKQRQETWARVQAGENTRKFLENAQKQGHSGLITGDIVDGIASSIAKYFESLTGKPAKTTEAAENLRQSFERTKSKLGNVKEVNDNLDSVYNDTVKVKTVDKVVMFYEPKDVTSLFEHNDKTQWFIDQVRSGLTNESRDVWDAKFMLSQFLYELSQGLKLKTAKTIDLNKIFPDKYTPEQSARLLKVFQKYGNDIYLGGTVGDALQMDGVKLPEKVRPTKDVDISIVNDSRLDAMQFGRELMEALIEPGDRIAVDSKVMADGTPVELLLGKNAKDGSLLYAIVDKRGLIIDSDTFGELFDVSYRTHFKNDMLLNEWTAKKKFVTIDGVKVADLRNQILDRATILLTPASEFRFFGEGVQQRGMAGTFGQMSKTSETGEITGVKAYRGMKDWERFEFENYYLISELRKQGLIDVDVFQALKDLMRIAKNAEKTTFYDGYSGKGELYNTYLGEKGTPTPQPKVTAQVPPEPKIVITPESTLANIFELLGLENTAQLAQKAKSNALDSDSVALIAKRLGVEPKLLVKEFKNVDGSMSTVWDVLSKIDNVNTMVKLVKGNLGSGDIKKLTVDKSAVKWQKNLVENQRQSRIGVYSDLVNILNDRNINPEQRLVNLINVAIDQVELRNKILDISNGVYTLDQMSNFIKNTYSSQVWGERIRILGESFEIVGDAVSKSTAETFDNIKPVIVDALKDMGDTITMFNKPISDLASATGKTAQSIARSEAIKIMGESFGIINDAMRAATKETWVNVKPVVLNALKDMKDTLPMVRDALADYYKMGTNTARAVANSEAVKIMGESLGIVSDKMREASRETWDNVKPLILNSIKDMQDTLPMVAEAMIELGRYTGNKAQMIARTEAVKIMADSLIIIKDAVGRSTRETYSNIKPLVLDTVKDIKGTLPMVAESMADLGKWSADKIRIVANSEAVKIMVDSFGIFDDAVRTSSIETYDNIKPVLQNALKDMQDTLPDVADAIVDLAKITGNTARAIARADAIRIMGESFGIINDALKTSTKETWDNVKPVVVDALKDIRDTLPMVQESINELAKYGADVAKAIARSESVKLMADSFKIFGDAVRTSSIETYDNIKPLMLNALKDMKDTLPMVSESMGDLAKATGRTAQYVARSEAVRIMGEAIDEAGKAIRDSSKETWVNIKPLVVNSVIDMRDTFPMIIDVMSDVTKDGIRLAKVLGKTEMVRIMGQSFAIFDDAIRTSSKETWENTKPVILNAIKDLRDTLPMVGEVITDTAKSGVDTAKALARSNAVKYTIETLDIVRDAVRDSTRETYDNLKPFMDDRLIDLKGTMPMVLEVMGDWAIEVGKIPSIISVNAKLFNQKFIVEPYTKIHDIFLREDMVRRMYALESLVRPLPPYEVYKEMLIEYAKRQYLIERLGKLPEKVVEVKVEKPITKETVMRLIDTTDGQKLVDAIAVEYGIPTTKMKFDISDEQYRAKGTHIMEGDETSISISSRIDPSEIHEVVLHELIHNTGTIELTSPQMKKVTELMDSTGKGNINPWNSNRIMEEAVFEAVTELYTSKLLGTKSDKHHPVKELVDFANDLYGNNVGGKLATIIQEWVDELPVPANSPKNVTELKERLANKGIDIDKMIRQVIVSDTTEIKAKRAQDIESKKSQIDKVKKEYDSQIVQILELKDKLQNEPGAVEIGQLRDVISVERESIRNLESGINTLKKDISKFSNVDESIKGSRLKIETIKKTIADNEVKLNALKSEPREVANIKDITDLQISINKKQAQLKSLEGESAKQRASAESLRLKQSELSNLETTLANDVARLESLRKVSVTDDMVIKQELDQLLDKIGVSLVDNTTYESAKIINIEPTELISANSNMGFIRKFGGIRGEWDSHIATVKRIERKGVQPFYTPEEFALATIKDDPYGFRGYGHIKGTDPISKGDILQLADYILRYYGWLKTPSVLNVEIGSLEKVIAGKGNRIKLLKDELIGKESSVGIASKITEIEVIRKSILADNAVLKELTNRFNINKKIDRDIDRLTKDTDSKRLEINRLQENLSMLEESKVSGISSRELIDREIKSKNDEILKLNDEISINATKLVELENKLGSSDIAKEVEIIQKESWKKEAELERLADELFELESTRIEPEIISAVGEKRIPSMVPMVEVGKTSTIMERARAIREERKKVEVPMGEPSIKMKVPSSVTVPFTSKEKVAYESILGDTHADLSQVKKLLRRSEVIDSEANLAQGTKFYNTGDLATKGKASWRTLEFIKKLFDQAPSKNSVVGIVGGNHDIRMVAVAKRAKELGIKTVEEFNKVTNAKDKALFDDYVKYGGDIGTALKLGNDAVMLKWLSDLPAMILTDSNDLIVHTNNAQFYKKYGNSIKEVNDNVRKAMKTVDGAYQVAKDMLSDKPWTEAEVNDMLATYGGKRVIHGHIPVKEITTYFKGKAVNVDTGLKKLMVLQGEPIRATLTKYLTPSEMRNPYRIIHVTRDARNMRRAAEAGKPLIPGYGYDDNLKLIKLPQDEMYFSGQAALNHARDMLTGEMGIDPAIVIFDVMPDEFYKNFRRVNRSETFPEGTGLSIGGTRLWGSVEPVAYVLDEFVSLPKAKPTEGFIGLLDDNGKMVDIPSYDSRTGERISVLNFASPKAIEFGIKPPTRSQIRRQNWIAFGEGLKDILSPRIPGEFIVSSQYSPLPADAVIFGRRTLEYKQYNPTPQEKISREQFATGFAGGITDKLKEQYTAVGKKLTMDESSQITNSVNKKIGQMFDNIDKSGGEIGDVRFVDGQSKLKEYAKREIKNIEKDVFKKEVLPDEYINKMADDIVRKTSDSYRSEYAHITVKKPTGISRVTSPLLTTELLTSKWTTEVPVSEIVSKIVTAKTPIESPTETPTGTASGTATGTGTVSGSPSVSPTLSTPVTTQTTPTTTPTTPFTPSTPTTPPFTIPIPPTKTPPTIIPPPVLEKFKNKKGEYEGLIAWKQGWIFKILYPPFSQTDILNTRKPVEGVDYAKGLRSAYDSIVRRGGYVPPVITRDMGIYTVTVRTMKDQRKPELQFRRDIKDTYKGKGKKKVAKMPKTRIVRF